MLFDTHCHPHLNKTKKTPDIIWGFFNAWWTYLNVIGTDTQTNTRVIELIQEYPNAYGGIWIHPCDIGELDLASTMDLLKKQYNDNQEKIIALWETGLDYYWVEKDALKYFPTSIESQQKYIDQIKKQQKLFFQAHIVLARELNLPIIIHNRDAKDDVFWILEKMQCKNFIFHCYSEDLAYAQKIIQFAPESKLSFSGIVTFKNANDIQEAAKNIPLKNIICETDSPYLTPTPHRGKQENEPLFTQYVVDYIAELREEDNEVIKQKIFTNSCEIFGIKKDA